MGFSQSCTLYPQVIEPLCCAKHSPRSGRASRKEDTRPLPSPCPMVWFCRQTSTITRLKSQLQSEQRHKRLQRKPQGREKNPGRIWENFLVEIGCELNTAEWVRFYRWEGKVVGRAFYVEWANSLYFDTMITENIMVK